MTARRVAGCAALAGVSLLAGCHHRAPVQAPVAPPPVTATSGPVMVSVPPPTHRSTDSSGEVPTRSDIPVIKPVRPPRRPSRRSQQQPAAPPVAAGNAPAPSTTPATRPAQSLGQLTATTNDPAATRDGAGQAIRHENERVASIPAQIQSAHASELEQARRFLKSATDSWNAADYPAALALSIKARVLLDDVLK